MANNKNLEIESLRAFAILLVMFRHLHYSLPISVTDYPLILQGTWSGVDLFFVISGFVITKSLLANYSRWKEGSLSFGRLLGAFYVRRLFRLLPVAYVVLAVFIFLSYYFNSSHAFPDTAVLLKETPYVLLYVYNIAIPIISSSELGWLWSLSVEEQFYLFYPLLLLVIPKTKAKIFLFASIIIAVTFLVRPIWANYKDAKGLWPLFTTPTFLRCDLLMAGCLLAFIKLPVLKISPLLSKIFFFVCLLMIATTGGWLKNEPLFLYPVILIFAAGLVALAAYQKNIIPVNKFFTWVGARSYSLYLIDIPVLYFTNECFYHITGEKIKSASFLLGSISLLASTLLCFLIAELLHRFVEKPCINFGKKYAQRIENKTMAI